MLQILPTRIGGAAENMALDFLLLQSYPDRQAGRFRHYGWRAPAITFGYSQRWEEVQAQAPTDREFCRRPTGGGIVDHANDWTYSLVLPRSHELCKQPASLVYYLIHRVLCEALLAEGQDVQLQQPEEISSKKAAGPDVCFRQPEPHDIVICSTNAKVAGAALKRTKNGLLVQGSLARALLNNLDWDGFENALHSRLSEMLSLEAVGCPWPDFDPDQEIHLIDQFSDSAWNQRR